MGSPSYWAHLGTVWRGCEDYAISLGWGGGLEDTLDRISLWLKRVFFPHPPTLRKELTVLSTFGAQGFGGEGAPMVLGAVAGSWSAPAANVIMVA